MENINQLLKVRREKLDKVRELGVNPYPNHCKRTHNIGELIEKKDRFLESGEKVIIAGRLNAMRRQGKVGFGNVSDNSGKIQLLEIQLASVLDKKPRVKKAQNDAP